MNGYTKLFASIITSTVWREDDKTRIVWITMLALRNRFHVVEASIPGLADMAKVSIQDCEKALEKLSSPDSYSRTEDFEGRRIEKVDDGWLVLNGEKYKNKLDAEERREKNRIYKQRSRERRLLRKRVSKNVSKDADTPDKVEMSAQAEAEAEAEAQYKKLTNVSFLDSLKKDSFLAGIDIDQELLKAKRWCKSKNRKCTERFFRKWIEHADRIVPDPLPKSTSDYVEPTPPPQPTPDQERERQKAIISQQVQSLAYQFKMRS